MRSGSGASPRLAPDPRALWDLDGAFATRAGRSLPVVTEYRDVGRPGTTGAAERALRARWLETLPVSARASGLGPRRPTTSRSTSGTRCTTHAAASSPPTSAARQRGPRPGELSKPTMIRSSMRCRWLVGSAEPRPTRTTVHPRTLRSSWSDYGWSGPRGSRAPRTSGGAHLRRTRGVDSGSRGWRSQAADVASRQCPAHSTFDSPPSSLAR